MTGALSRLRRAGRCCRSALLAMLLVVAPSAAFAHAGLIGSNPVNDAVLAVAPQTLTLSFNEPVEPLVMQLIDRNGVATSITRIDRSGGNLMLTPPATLGAGAHILSWRVRSEDGHPVGGSLTFWIGARDAAVPDVASTANRPLAVAIWATRLVIYLGLFAGVGGALFFAWMKVAAVPRRLRAAIIVITGIALPALALSIGLQGLDALAAPWSGLLLASIWSAGAQGSFGEAAAIAAAAMLLGLLSLRYDEARARLVSLAAMLAVGLALAASGHAAGAPPRWLTTTSVFLHAVSLTFWIGALLPLVAVLRASGTEALVPLQRFSRAIPLAITALLTSGACLAVIQLQRIDALWRTDYGIVLAVKLALVALLLAIALWNRIALTPQVATGSQPSLRRLRNSIVTELALVAFILGTVGLWRFTPPPRLLAASNDSFFTHIHTDRLMANVTIQPSRSGSVEIVIQLETPDERALVARAVTVTLANPALGVEALSAEAQESGADTWRVTMSAPIAGRWSLGLRVLISDFDQVSVEAPIIVK